MTQVTIQKLGHKGDGIAEGPIHVTRALPGEVVEGDVVDGRMDAPRIVTPSTDRVAAPCKQYKRCGGCVVQHASDEFVAGWKRDLVVAALAARGLEAPIRRMHTSPAQSRRRAVLSGLRTKSGALVGYHTRASDTVIAIPDCQVLHPGLMAAMPAFEALTRLGASRKSSIRLSVTYTNGGVDVAVEGAKEMGPTLWSQVVDIARQFDLARLNWNGDEVVERRRPELKLGRADVAPPPGGFLQATEAGEAALLASVRDAVGDARQLVDLFCGIGTFSLPLAMAAEVHAVEGESEMLAVLDRGWRHGQDLHLVTTEKRDLFRRPLEASELKRFDAAVIDPPRAGAEAQVACLAEGGPARLAMVSCNPATFARDARVLVDAGYALNWVDVIDQFRWSAHVELAASFTR